ncbi:MAG: phosphoenolpyruvate synthase [Proteobacteria bacterium]|nr:phosphoenolpyruvate synthase [Pseudomonadota bacterium]MBU1738265.1 phosphoenolpyruvate synthase [Pseudomonadota bacterium]
MTSDKPEIESDALKANLLETAVSEVEIDPSYAVLQEIVGSYKGIANSLHYLLYEISHPFHNWMIILPKLRAFTLKNLNHYKRHEKGPEALEQFCLIYLKAAGETRKNENQLAMAMESLLAYLEKMISALELEDLPRYESALAFCFRQLQELEESTMLFMVQGHHPIKKIARTMLEKAGRSDYDFTDLAGLMKKILQLNYEYWLQEEDPQPWFAAECGDLCSGWQAGQLFNAISHQQINVHRKEAEAIAVDESPRSALEHLLELPAHMDLVRLYKQIPEKLVEEGGDIVESAAPDRFAENRKLLFLFRIMDTAGLYLIHEETLREINRSLIQLIRQQDFEEIESFLLTTFKLLKANVRRYPHTSLQCIQVLGTEVFKRESSRLVETFLWETVRFGFQYAKVSGVDEEWQPIYNPSHLENIRVWLSLIMQEPKWCSTLFSALIINLKLSGTCVKDTDLFQRDISSLLNHPIEPVYNLVKQFAKLMPVFFNEIGAEGILRDVSTEIDEIHQRKDLLIHFLRKQSHVESSNLIVDFILAIFDFWNSLDKSVLAPYLPEEVLKQIRTEGVYVDDLHTLMTRMMSSRGTTGIEQIFNWEERRFDSFISRQTDLSETETRRFSLLVRMFRLVNQKYNLGFQELRLQLEQAANSGFPEMTDLLVALESSDVFQNLDALLTSLENLQEVILSEEQFEAKEDIYHKRHIAVDIPSVYGRYRERKFDALGLTFRLENLANIYLEKLPEIVNPSFITRATFIKIIKCLRLYLRALSIDGITSRRLETYLSFLSSSIGIKRFSYTQYLDIFRGLSEGVKDVIYAYYTNIHEGNIAIIVPQICSGEDNLLAKYRSLWSAGDATGSTHRLSETFLRDLIAGTFGLQHLDNFITRIYQTLENQRDVLDEKSLDLLMTYNPEMVISSLTERGPFSKNLILLGNKGYNLTQLAADGKPVPQGFVITTEIFRCWPVVKKFSRARDDLMARIRDMLSEIEAATGRNFGDPETPLLLSVRSGSAISMPGMMATIHNVGLNEDIVEGFARSSGKEYFAWDNYRRFLQSWAMTGGLDRDKFQALMNSAKKRHKVEVKKHFSPGQMKELALEYRENIRSAGIEIPDDPWLQLTGAIEMVLQSWDAEKTREYRELMDVSENWGTAVIVQQMVFGNLGDSSGSGVLFTAHPYRKVRRVALWGDYAVSDQGEDIVSGLVATHPVSVEQSEIDGRDGEMSLEKKFPAVYQRLLEISRDLVYVKHWNPQEIEFTFEGPKAEDLYLLQTRDMITIKKKERFLVFDCDIRPYVLGHCIGVSGSALSGRAVFTAANINALREQDPDTPLILIRQDTVPEDIRDIARVDGLLTARGGQTSHASVVTLRLEKTCAVGCNALKVYDTEERAEINGQEIRFGDEISIDGRKGLFLKGVHPVKEEIHILPI